MRAYRSKSAFVGCDGWHDGIRSVRLGAREGRTNRASMNPVPNRPPSALYRRIADLDLPTFFVVLFVTVALAVAAGLLLANAILRASGGVL